jgi:hypothetical protein
MFSFLSNHSARHASEDLSDRLFDFLTTPTVAINYSQNIPGVEHCHTGYLGLQGSEWYYQEPYPSGVPVGFYIIFIDCIRKFQL